MTPTRNSANGAGHIEGATLDLDTFERPDGPGPFAVTLGRRRYELASPEELDYRELNDAMVFATNGDVVGALNKLLAEEDRSEFWENRIPAFKMQALVGGFMDHYGLEKAS